MDTTCGIYKITNKINQKSYIGQSIHIEERWKQHIYSSNNINHSSYNDYIHKAIRKYGIDNFTWEILEICPREELNEKEIYWIAFYDSYNNGYNMTPGGNNHLNRPCMKGEKNIKARLTNEEVYNIRTRLLNGELPSQVFIDYEDKISKSAFMKIWQGKTWKDILPEAIKYSKTDEYIKKVRQYAANISVEKRGFK